MSFEWFIARRYLTARRRQAFISLISGVSILGVGVGVMALVVALGLMTGVQSELRDRIVGSTAHVYVYRTGGYEGQDLDREIQQLMLPGVAGAAPAVVGKGMMESTVADAAPVDLKGIDPSREEQVTDIRAAMQSGSLDALLSRKPDAKDGVILGAGLAKDLRVSVGDLVWLLTPSLVVGPGTAAAKTRSLEVVGIAKFGIYQTDAFQTFVTLETAEQMLGKPAPDLIQLKLSDLEQAPAISRQLEEKLGLKYSVENWTEINGPLYSALWLEKVAISLTIGLIVMVAALNIVASLVLLVMEKSRDIAILRTMGAPARAIRRIFVFQGLTIGLLGTISGTILGLIVCYVADKYRLIHLQSDVYQITYLPFRVRPIDIAVVVISAVAVCLIATIYPSRQAGRLDPAEALRNQ
jgi:lipoprotein-releasing system permease protein